MPAKNTTIDTGCIPTKPPDAPNVNTVMGVREWGLILILSVIWGGSWIPTPVLQP